MLSHGSRGWDDPERTRASLDYSQWNPGRCGIGAVPLAFSSSAVWVPVPHRPGGIPGRVAVGQHERPRHHASSWLKFAATSTNREVRSTVAMPPEN